MYFCAMWCRVGCNRKVLFWLVLVLSGVCSSPAKCPAIGWHGRLRPVTFVGSTLISVTYVTPRFPAVPSDPQQSPASPAVPSRPQPSPAVPSGPKPSEPSPAVPSSPAVTAGRPECVLSRPRAHQLHLSSTDLYSDSEQSTARAFFISRSLRPSGREGAACGSRCLCR
jgi:hypothetical protein